MIKINLLLARKEKKKGGIPKELLVLVLSVALLLILFGLDQWRVSRKKDDLSAKIAETKKQIAYYKSLTSEVNQARQAQQTLQEKLNVINTLRKEKGGPARVLDELSVDKPEKVHLEGVKKEGSKLLIEGIALDDDTIANFMTNLRNSKLFRNVDLIVSEQIELSKVKLKKFSLSCEITLM